MTSCRVCPSARLMCTRTANDCMFEQQIAAFFRGRAELEEKYARGMSELVRGSADSYSRAFCKAGYVRHVCLNNVWY